MTTEPAVPDRPPPWPAPAPALPTHATGSVYRSPRRLGTVLCWLLVLCVGAEGVALAIGIRDYDLVGRLIEGTGSVSVGQIEARDARTAAISLIELVLILVTGVVFILWTRRLYRNLEPLGVSRLRFTPGWAVAGWLVPIMNLFRPKQILDDVWRATEPNGRPGADWHQRSVTPLLWWWWVLWIASWLLGLSASSEPADLDDLRDDLVTSALASLALAVSGMLAVLLVRRLTDRQRSFANAVQDAPGTTTSVATWMAPIVGCLCFGLAFAMLGTSDDAREPGDETVTSAAPADGRSVFASDLAVGDCFDDPASFTDDTSLVLGVDLISCDEPHDNEVYAIVQHPAVSSVDFPGDDVLAEYAFNRCQALFEPWLGAEYQDSELDIFYLGPSEMSWSRKHRDITCLAYRLDLQKLEGSAKGTGI